MQENTIINISMYIKTKEVKLLVKKWTWDK
jgi:hypothetical protein